MRCESGDPGLISSVDLSHQTRLFAKMGDKVSWKLARNEKEK